MDKQEVYSLLFTDSLVANFAINNSTELAIVSMKTFSDLYSTYTILAIATCAAFFAFSANYLLGIVCYKILAPTNTEESAKNDFERISALRQSRALPLILCLSGIPFFGKFIILFAGFCRVSFAQTIIIGTLAKFIYYLLTYSIL
jgi:membrane protein YqaA with SNARE-associated domain